MATWVGVVTNAGKALFATWLDGTTFNFDGAEGGTGVVSEAALMAQTALNNKKQNLSILDASRVADGIKLTVQIVAPVTGYTLNQIGIKGSVGGGASVLIALFQNATGITIPNSAGTPDFIYKFFGTIIVSNTGTFTLAIDTSALVSQSTLDEAMETKQGKITSTGMLVGNGAGNVTTAVAGVDYGFPLPSGTTAPTPSTIGAVGQHYFNTATGEEFVCTKIEGSVYTWRLAGINDASDITYSGKPLDDFLESLSADQVAYLNAALPNISTVNGMLDSLQSNKMQYWGVINSATQAHKDGYYYVYNGDSTLPQKWGHLYYFAQSNAQEESQVFISPNGGADSNNPTSMYIRYKPYTKGWLPWKCITTAEPPQENALPLTAGFVTKDTESIYAKNQLGTVFVSFKVVQPAGISAGLIHIATLPEGFRPPIEVAYHGVCVHASFIGPTYPFFITSDGHVNVNVLDAIPAAAYCGFAGSILFIGR